MKTLLPRRPAAILFACVGTLLVCTPSQAEDQDYRPGLFGRIFPPPPHGRRVVRVRVIRQHAPQQTYQASAPTVIFSGEPAIDSQGSAQETSATAPRQRMEIPINGTRPILRSEYSNELGARQLQPNLEVDDNGRPITSTPADANGPTINGRAPQVNAPSALAPNPARLSTDVSADPQAAKPDTAANASTQKKTETTASKPVPPASSYPMGTRSTKPGFVKSPYEPFNELDASGLYAGMLARDPTTGKIFRVP